MQPPKTTKNPVFPLMPTLGTAKWVVNNFAEPISLTGSMACGELQSLIQDLSTNPCFVSYFEIQRASDRCEIRFRNGQRLHDAVQHRRIGPAEGFPQRQPGRAQWRPVREKKWRSRPISRVLSWTVIPLGASSPIRSSNLPGPDAGSAMRSLFGLAPGGVCRAGLLPDSRCALTAPFHPCHARLATPFGGLLSVALSVGSRRPGVTWHRALWSPDFPRHPFPPKWSRMTRLSGRLRRVQSTGCAVVAGGLG